ncbi:MAG: hypothetical protein ACO1RX_21375 [Candidatus Sericytochromatia bacterium]
MGSSFLGLHGLALDADLVAELQSAGVQDWKQLRDLTLPALQARTAWPHSVAKQVLYKLDHACQARFRGEVVLPSLAAPCQEIALDYLLLSDSTLAVLAAHGLEYIYQLAFSRQPRLESWLGKMEAEAAVQVLKAWFADWRRGEFELYEEN